MKQSGGVTRPLPTAITLVTMIASLVLLSLSMRSPPPGTAYAGWTGIGTVGAFGVGILALGEQVSTLRVRASVLIVSVLVLMKVPAADGRAPAQDCRATTKQQIDQNSGYSAPPKFHIHLPADTRQLAHEATSRNRPVSTATGRV